MEANPSLIRLFDKAAFAAARYPRLQAVFERMVAASVDSLREVCTVAPQYVFKEVQTEPLGETLDRIGEDGIAALFHVPEWNARLLLCVDRPFVYAVTEALLGGDGSEPPFEEKRRFSSIEKTIARAAMLSVARALQGALAPVADLTVSFERLETNMQLVTLDDRRSQAVVARFELNALGRVGALKVVIPHATIRAARATQSEADAAEAADNPMARQMQDEIRNTGVRLSAVLEEKRMTLAEIAGLNVGQLIPLDARVDGRVTLVCNDEPLLLCEIGQSEGAYALRVDKVLAGQERISA